MTTERKGWDAIASDEKIETSGRSPVMIHPGSNSTEDNKAQMSAGQIEKVTSFCNVTGIKPILNPLFDHFFTDGVFRVQVQLP